jgi:YfiH family protein
MGWPDMRVMRVNQVHGTEALVIDCRITNWPAFEAMAASEGHDAIVTNQPGIFLSVRSADCVPILFMDGDRRVVAAVHAGWRGTLGGIAAKTVKVMRDRFHCNPRSLRAAVGPSIGVCCYEVDDTVTRPLKRAYPFWREVVGKAAGSRVRLDLRRLNCLQMEEAGMEPSRIEAVNLCTACHPDLFHSYRRDGKETDHMTSGIGMTAFPG